MIIFVTYLHFNSALIALKQFIGTALFMLCKSFILTYFQTSHSLKFTMKFEFHKHILDGSMNLLKLRSFTSHWTISIVSLPLLDAHLTKRSVARTAFKSRVSHHSKTNQTLDCFDEFLKVFSITHSFYI